MAEKRTTRRPSTEKKASRRPRGGLAQEVRPDAALAAVIGSETATRAEVTKRIWAYIKQHDLQDPADRRKIVADDKLRPVFDGKEKVTMFEMTKLVNQHVQ